MNLHGSVAEQSPFDDIAFGNPFEPFLSNLLVLDLEEMRNAKIVTDAVSVKAIEQIAAFGGICKKRPIEPRGADPS